MLMEEAEAASLPPVAMLPGSDNCLSRLRVAATLAPRSVPGSRFEGELLDGGSSS